MAAFEDSGDALSRIYGAALRLYAERDGAAVPLSEIADAAGVARGTIYNNIAEPESLFADMASALAREMIARVEATLEGVDDPARRIATGLRLFARRAAAEPDWGRFLVRFAFGHAVLRDLMHEPPARDVTRAIETSRFRAGSAEAPAIVAMLAGATLAAAHGALDGGDDPTDPGATHAALFLRACGLPAAEARRIAHARLPPLASPPPPARGRRRRPS